MNHASREPADADGRHLEVAGLSWASEQATGEAVLGRRPGVLSVEANAVGQTATVSFDSQQASVAEIAGWVRALRLPLFGRQSVPRPVRDRGARAEDRHAGQRGHVDAGMAVDLAPAVPRRGGAERADPAVVEHRRDVFGFDVAAPFGLRDDVFQLLLSLPVILYSASIFFTGAWRALRARTLDMMVLVAVAIGAGWATRWA